MKKLLILLLLVPSLSWGAETSDKYCEIINEKTKDLKKSYVFYDEGTTEIWKERTEFMVKYDCDFNCQFNPSNELSKKIKTYGTYRDLTKKLYKYYDEWEDIKSDLKNHYTLWKYCQ